MEFCTATETESALIALSGSWALQNLQLKEIERLYKACCEAIDSHDASSVKNESVPTAKQLGQDIRDVRALAKAVNDRGK